MKSELAEDLIAFLSQSKDVGSVLGKRAGHELDVADELLMPHKLGAKGPSKSEIGMKDLWHQGGVRVVPHFLVEDADELLLSRPGDPRQIQRLLVHRGMG